MIFQFLCSWLGGWPQQCSSSGPSLHVGALTIPRTAFGGGRGGEERKDGRSYSLEWSYCPRVVYITAHKLLVIYMSGIGDNALIYYRLSRELSIAQQALAQVAILSPPVYCFAV